MALTQRLEVRQGQALVMTPQLQQAIKLLQLSNLELSTYVEGELEQNPLLERDDRPVEAAAETAPEAPGPAAVEASELWHEQSGSEGEGNLDYSGDPEAFKTRAGPVGDDMPGLDQTLVRHETLRDYLLA